MSYISDTTASTSHHSHYKTEGSFALSFGPFMVEIKMLTCRLYMKKKSVVNIEIDFPWIPETI